MGDPSSPAHAGDGRPGPEPPDPEGFFQRWSRRKARERAGQPAKGPAEDGEESGAEEDREETEEPALSDADMPPVEELGEDSDVSAFFAPGVSEELRQRALRRLFRGSKFNYRDGLEVYDGDYRSFERLGEVMTADLRHRLERRADEALAREGGRVAPASEAPSSGEPGEDPGDREGDGADETEPEST
jgi:hypothetical protein